MIGYPYDPQRPARLLKSSFTTNVSKAMRTTRLASMCVVAILCSLFSATASAQTPLARFVLPTNLTETAVQPTFRVITSLPIDTTSLHWSFFTADSTHVFGPTICVMAKTLQANTSDTAWKSLGRDGQGAV